MIDPRRWRDASWLPALPALLALLALCMLPACSRTPRTNVLVISIDTLRNDHCSFAGYARQTTPRLDQLAAEGMRMTQAYAPTSTTGPTHASIFTSLYPLSHGVVRNALALDEQFMTLAEALRDEGYATAAVVSSFVLDGQFGYAQGFDSYDAEFPLESATIVRNEMDGHAVDGAFDRRADATTRRAAQQLERLAADGDPFFMFVHYFDPHYPYVPPDGWRGRFAGDGADELQQELDAYDEEIGFTDQEVGRLLDRLGELGLDERTLVIVTSDHGEGLMQHGHMHHGLQIYEELVRVPLLLRLPGAIEAGRTIDEPVTVVDLFPTIFSLLELDSPTRLQGIDQAAAILNDAVPAPQRPIYLHRRHYDAGVVAGIPVAGEQFGMRIGDWKYIEGKQEEIRELFDLQRDPGESINLVQAEPKIADDLARTLESWKRGQLRAASEATISPENLAKMQALGYVEATPLPDDDEPSPEPEPSVDHER